MSNKQMNIFSPSYILKDIKVFTNSENPTNIQSISLQKEDSWIWVEK